MSKAIIGVAMIFFVLLMENQLSGARINMDKPLINWIRSNISPVTQLPYSFQIRSGDKASIYREMGQPDSVSAVIERVIVEEGLDIYDGAVGQIAMTLIGTEEDLKLAYRPIEVYWDGRVGEFNTIRAGGYPYQDFVYDPRQPLSVSPDLDDKGHRGFVFRIINADGLYSTQDPMDGKTKMEGFPTWPTIHWEDWKPVAGENAWVVMAALHLYHAKHYSGELKDYIHDYNSIELKLAEEIARAAMLLQDDNGAIRMAPLGTYRNPLDFTSPQQKQGTWWYNQISTENNISWYAAFRMLHQVTGNPRYKQALDDIERYFKSVWNDRSKYFYQGMSFYDDIWHVNNDHFALDVQTWMIAALGCETLDRWFGSGTAYQMWSVSKSTSGYYDPIGKLLGVGYTQEHDRLSVEWTAGAILATTDIASYYHEDFSLWANEAYEDSMNMREGVESLRKRVSWNKAAYAYSSKREWIPFGWYSHSPEVLSLASTGWVFLADQNFNPFYLPQP